MSGLDTQELEVTPSRSFDLDGVQPSVRILVAVALGATAILSFWFSPELGPEWQNGRLGGRAGLLLDLTAQGPFAVTTAASAQLVVIALVQPMLASRWIIRLGLYFAAAMALTYSAILVVATNGAPLAIAAAGFLGAVALRAIARRIASSDNPPKWIFAMVGSYFVITIGFAIANGEPAAIVLGPALLFVFAVGAGPLLFAVVAILLLRGSTARSTIPLPSVVAPVALFIGTWREGLLRSIEAYNELPTSPPNCYIATAAASGHSLVVQSSESARGIQVNRQLQTFKAGEIVIATTVPGLHRLVRKGYDRVGPPLAERMRNPWVGDIAYILLLPLELVARLVVRAIPRSRRADLISSLYE